MQPYPPQGYPPQQPPTTYPPTNPPAYPQGYAPAPVPGAYPAPAQQSYPAPAAPAQTMPGGDSFNSPGRVVNIIRPRIMDFGPGRLLLIKVTKLERQVPAPTRPGEPPKLQDKITADVVALDGPPFPYGGKPERDGTPHTHTGTPPEEWPGLWLTQDLIVRQCEKSVGGMVLGRLVRGQASDPSRNAPWRLDEPTEEDKVKARQYLAGAAIAAATPSPVAPPPAAAQVPPVPPAAPGSYPPPGYPVNAAPYASPQAPPAQVWDPATGQWTTPAAQVAQAYIGSPYPGSQYQPPAPAPHAPAQPAAYPPPPMAPPGPDPATAPPPPGMDPNIWATMPLEHRAAVLASTAAPAPWQ